MWVQVSILELSDVGSSFCVDIYDEHLKPLHFLMIFYSVYPTLKHWVQNEVGWSGSKETQSPSALLKILISIPRESTQFPNPRAHTRIIDTNEPNDTVPRGLYCHSDLSLLFDSGFYKIDRSARTVITFFFRFEIFFLLIELGDARL